MRTTTAWFRERVGPSSFHHSVWQSGTDLRCTVQLMTLDPGHFHAALVQKKMIAGMSPKVHVAEFSGLSAVRWKPFVHPVERTEVSKNNQVKRRPIKRRFSRVLGEKKSLPNKN